jgi:hypothetical protein
MILGKDAFRGVTAGDRQREQIRQLFNFVLGLCPINAGPGEHDWRASAKQKIHGAVYGAGVYCRGGWICRWGKSYRLRQMGFLQVFGDAEKHRTLAATGGLTVERVEHRAQFFDALQTRALFGDRLK